jgi:hypothetical protein
MPLITMALAYGVLCELIDLKECTV